jgi:hypothetical protein
LSGPHAQIAPADSWALWAFLAGRRPSGQGG